MVKTNANINGVMGVTSLVRTLNSHIGSYQEHFLNEDFGYSVKLYKRKTESRTKTRPRGYVPRSIAHNKINLKK